MSARGTLTVAVLGVALFASCRKSAAPTPAASADPAAQTQEAPAPAPAGGAQAPAVTLPQSLPPPVQPIIAVRVGTGLGADGGVASGQSTFKPGEDVLAAVDVSVLPAGTVVKAAWFDGSGGGRGEEQKTVIAGMRWLSFTAPGSFNWPEGGYRVDVSATSGGSASASFQIALPAADSGAPPG